MQNGYNSWFFYVSNPLRETKQTGNQPTVVTHNHTPRFSPVHLNMERELCCFSLLAAEAPAAARYWALWKRSSHKKTRKQSSCYQAMLKIHFWDSSIFFFLLWVAGESFEERFLTLSELVLTLLQFPFREPFLLTLMVPIFQIWTPTTITPHLLMEHELVLERGFF